MTTIERPDARQHRPDAAYFRELIERAGISQRAAARALDLDERSMRYYASGQKPMPYPVQYCLEVLAAGGVGDQAAPLEVSTWHEAAVRPITKRDDGLLIVGTGAGGWVFGRIRADGFGPVIEGVLAEGSTPVSAIARYTLISETASGNSVARDARVFRLSACGGTVLDESEQRAGIHAATELCETLGVDMDTAYRAAMEDIDRGNDNSPAHALWCRIESRAVEAATNGWQRVPDDLSLAPA